MLGYLKQRTVSFELNREDKADFKIVKRIEKKVQESIKLLKEIYIETHDSERRYALKSAITEMQKAIPTKPDNNGNWNPKTCPICGEELSIFHGDGYYSDLKGLDSCPGCRQLLDWDN